MSSDMRGNQGSAGFTDSLRAVLRFGDRDGVPSGATAWGSGSLRGERSGQLERSAVKSSGVDIADRFGLAHRSGRQPG